MTFVSSVSSRVHVNVQSHQQSDIHSKSRVFTLNFPLNHRHTFAYHLCHRRGLPESFLPFVFDRFRQAEGSISRRQGGLGLGLAVARHLVELHGGHIRAESGGPQQGSTFIVDLPLADERRDPARQQERQREIERRGSGPAMARLDGICVLLVEDDEDSRKLLGLMLTRRGAEVISTSSSAEALAQFGRVAGGNSQ